MIRRRMHLLPVFIIGMMLLITACGDRDPTADSINLTNSPIDSSGVILDQIVSSTDSSVLKNNLSQPLDQRVVLKDATLQIVADDVLATISTISQLAEEMGGWVVNSNTSKSTRSSGEEVITGSIVVRVPADQLNSALSQIKGQAASVDAESQTGTDVTQEYTDLNSQIKNLQAAEAQLQTLFDRAQTTDSVLQVYNELVRVRGEIETAQGRINYFNEAANYSSITVSLRPPTVPQSAVQVDTAWSPATAVTGAFNSLVNVLQGLANLMIFIVVLVIPLLLIIGLPLRLAYKLLKRYGWFSDRPSLNTKVESHVG